MIVQGKYTGQNILYLFVMGMRRKAGKVRTEKGSFMPDVAIRIQAAL